MAEKGDDRRARRAKGGDDEDAGEGDGTRPRLGARPGATRCPFCLEDVEPDEDVSVCRACLVRHHRECWDESGRCSGCGGKTALVEAAPARASGSRLALGLGLAAAVACAAVIFALGRSEPPPTKHPVAVVGPDAPEAPGTKAFSVTWLAPSVTAPFVEDGLYGFALPGLADADYVPTVAPARGEPILGGPPSATWRPARLVTMSEDDLRYSDPRHAARLWASDARRVARVESDGDGRTILIHSAGSEGQPRRVELSARVADMALSGNRLLCVYGDRPFLTVVDLATGATRDLGIPDGAASAIAVSPRNPRLALLYVHESFVGFDAGTLKFLGSRPDKGTELRGSNVQLWLGGDARYVYASRTDVSPRGVVAYDAGQDYAQAYYGHDSWDWEPDGPGRMVVTSNGLYAPGLGEQVRDGYFRHRGNLADGSILALASTNHDEKTPLVVLDGKTGETLASEPVGVPFDGGYNGRLGLEVLPGTNRLVALTREGYVYRDLERGTGTGAATGAAPPAEAFVGEPWTYPLAAEGEVAIASPTGMTWDPARRALVWTPGAIQEGEQALRVKATVGGAERAVEAKVKVGHRVLELRQATQWGSLAAGSLWWLERDQTLALLDPVTRERRTIPLPAPVQEVVESRGKLYALAAEGWVLEVDPARLACTRRCQLDQPQLHSLAATPDGKALTVVSREDRLGALSLVRVPLEHDSGEVRAIPIPERERRERYTFEKDVPKVVWLDATRFALAGGGPRFYEGWIGGQPRREAAKTWTWGPDGIVAGEPISDVPTGLARGLVLAREGILDERGELRVALPDCETLVSPDGTYLAAVALGAQEEVKVRFLSVPDLRDLGRATFTVPRSSYSQSFAKAVLLDRAGVVVVQRNETFKNGLVLHWFRFDRGSWSR